jgi:hypothetical protein
MCLVAMAFSTVIINGSTTKYILQGLGLLKMTPQQLGVLEQVLQVILAGLLAMPVQLS